MKKEFNVLDYQEKKVHIVGNVYSYNGFQYRESVHREKLHDNGLDLPIVGFKSNGKSWATIIAQEVGWKTLPSGERVRTNEYDPSAWAHCPDLIGKSVLSYELKQVS